jgi:GT2 family glycosyltransferase/glycosyltransferase involved in cell wall biosynthesis
VRLDERSEPQLRYRVERAGGIPLREMIDRAARHALALAVGLAAIPLSAGLGLAALVAEGVARLRPRRRPEPAPARRGPRLATIQILNYQGRELLERNLPSVIAAAPAPHEILVVDNGSSDGSVEMLREKFPQVKVVALERNYFFSRGNNAGVPHARHDIVVLLNNDMRVEPDFLAPLLAPFEDDDVFAVSSQIFFTPGAKNREETGLTRARFSDGAFEYSHDPVPADPPAAIPILWGSGGSSAFDKRKWEALGGLDVMFDPFYFEDLDLSLRAWRRGWKVLLAPESKVWHEHRATTRRVFGEDFVNETFRRNSYLLQWADLRDPALFASHLLHLPMLAARDVRKHGLPGAKSFARALLKAPQALSRRMRRRGDGPPQRRVLEDTNLARPDVLFRQPKRLREGAPLEIAMVTPYHFWPIEHGGAKRMYHAARELARRGHQVSVVGFVDRDEQRSAAEHLLGFCAEVRLLTRRPQREARLTALPSEVIDFDRPELHRELNALIARRDPDVIQVEYTHLAPYGRPWPRAAVCLTEHDVAFVSRYRQMRVAHGLRAKGDAYLRYLRMFHFEVKSLRRFDAVFTMSNHDAEILRPYLDGVRISPAGRIGVEELDEPRAPDPATLLFVGHFEHEPNVDAILWFAREVLPLVWATRPDVKVEIAGGDLTREVRALASDARVSVAGFVPDLAALYSRATVSVAPIRIGSGVRVKVLEAFAASVPVVATPMGAEGLDVADGRELALADSPQSFARRVLSMLAAPAETEAMGRRGRQFARDRYSWGTICAELEEEYRAALRRKGLLG